VHYIRFLLFGDEIASLVFGQAGIHQGPNLGVLAIGIELLAGSGGRARARRLLHDLYHEWRSAVSKYINALPEVDCDRYFY
jgi:hypothetical protein